MAFSLQLFKAEIVDRFARDNFTRISDFLRRDLFRKGQWAFFERTFASPVFPLTTTFQHNLGFIPKDAVLLSISPDSETATWNYDSFNRDTVSITVSAACTVRAYIGRFEEGA